MGKAGKTAEHQKENPDPVCPGKLLRDARQAERSRPGPGQRRERPAPRGGGRRARPAGGAGAAPGGARCAARPRGQQVTAGRADPEPEPEPERVPRGASHSRAGPRGRRTLREHGGAARGAQERGAAAARAPGAVAAAATAAAAAAGRGRRHGPLDPDQAAEVRGR